MLSVAQGNTEEEDKERVEEARQPGTTRSERTVGFEVDCPSLSMHFQGPGASSDWPVRNTEWAIHSFEPLPSSSR